MKINLNFLLKNQIINKFYISLLILEIIFTKY